MSLAIGEFAGVGRGVTLGFICGEGVALGTSNRPRLCDAAGGADAVVGGAEVAAAVAIGVVVAAAVGAGFAVVDAGLSAA